MKSIKRSAISKFPGADLAEISKNKKQAKINCAADTSKLTENILIEADKSLIINDLVNAGTDKEKLINRLANYPEEEQYSKLREMHQKLILFK
jgi:hypothetical protein